MAKAEMAGQLPIAEGGTKSAFCVSQRSYFPPEATMRPEWPSLKRQPG